MLEKIIDGRTDLVFEYLENGNDANSKDKHGTSLIKYCAYFGDVSAIRYLVSQGAKLSDLGKNYDLNGAAFHGHWQLCQFLIENGADVNHVLPETGESPLHSCIDPSRILEANQIIQLLLAHGADPNCRTLPRKETGSFMRDVYTREETPLHRAAAFGNTTTIQLLLTAGADKTIRDMNGDSPLGWASWHCRPGKILSLLAYGEHAIHPLHIIRIKSDHGVGDHSGMAYNLMGKLHS